MAEALRIAIVGAESTGKTTLARELAVQLALPGRRRVAWVPEVLREWCQAAGRTPRAHEQAAILQAQHLRIEAAAAVHEVVVCDTTALMTAVYSRLVFGDRSLDGTALALHRRMALTLLTALDLPWVADGHQRDGAHVREPVDTLVRELLGTHGLPWSVVGGSGPARLQQALQAVRPLLAAAGDAPARGGLFTRLEGDGAAAAGWSCSCCSDPASERALQRLAGRQA